MIKTIKCLLLAAVCFFAGSMAAYRLITDENIHPGNTCRYTLGTAVEITEE